MINCSWDTLEEIKWIISRELVLLLETLSVINKCSVCLLGYDSADSQKCFLWLNSVHGFGIENGCINPAARSIC